VGNFSGAGFDAQEANYDFHHNFFSNFGGELPSLTNRTARWVNNVVYDWSKFASDFLGGVQVDIIGNRYKAGPLNAGARAHEIEASDAGAAPNPGPPSLYLSGNVGPNQPDAAGDQALLLAAIAGEGSAEVGPVPSSWIRTTPLPALVGDGGSGYVPIVADPVANLEATLLPEVGNSRGLDCMGVWVGRRDNVDARLINEYLDGGVGALFSSTTYPVPSIAAGTACASTSHDGIPDAWATAHGLSPSDATKGARDAGNGWTWLDRYLGGF
jgi:hypothetical protein